MRLCFIACFVCCVRCKSVLMGGRHCCAIGPLHVSRTLAMLTMLCASLMATEAGYVPGPGLQSDVAWSSHRTHVMPKMRPAS